MYGAKGEKRSKSSVRERIARGKKYIYLFCRVKKKK